MGTCRSEQANQPALEDPLNIGFDFELRESTAELLIEERYYVT